MSPERATTQTVDEATTNVATRQEEGGSQDTSLARGRSARRSDAVQLLALQGMAGNRAVATMVQRAGEGSVLESEAPESEAEQGSGPAPDANVGVGGEDPGNLPGSVPEGAGPEGPAPEGGGEPPNIQAVVNQQVNALPEAPEEIERADEAQAQARRQGEEAREIGLEGRPALAEFVQAQAAGEDGSPPPSRLERFASWAGGGLSTAGRGIASAGSAVWGGMKTVGGGIWSAMKAVGGFFSSVGKGIHGFFSRDKKLDKTVGGEKFNSSRRSDKQANFLRSGGAKASSGASATGTVLSKLGTVGSATANVIAKVTGAVGIFFSSIQAAFDIRALVSARRQVKNFDEMYKDALASGVADEEVLKAVKFAMEQKYSKVIKRAIAVVGSLFSIAAGAGLLAITLASNPVGWFILAAMAGVGAIIGLGVGIYKFARWMKKPAAELGRKRREMARQLMMGLGFGDPLAISALKELHLEPTQLQAEEHDIAIEMVAEKLKSA